MLKKIWKDPVCSKVIAYGIIGLITLVATWFSGYWPAIVEFLKYPITLPLWGIIIMIFIILVLAIFIIISLIKKAWSKKDSCSYSPLKIYEINSSDSHSLKDDIGCVLWECGTIMCWVYVTPLGEGIRDLQNNRYIFAHISKAAPGSIYYNRFSMGCLGKKGVKRWEVTLTNNNAEQSTLTINDKLKTGWHHFVVSWNRKKNQINFFIDLGKSGNDFSKSVSNWPEKYSEKLFIGSWSGNSACHYCNTKITYPEIIPKHLNYKSHEVIESFKRKP